LLNFRIFDKVIDEFTKGTATSGSQYESAIFLSLKFPFKQALKIKKMNTPIKHLDIFRNLFMSKTLTFGKCKKNIETKKGDIF